METIGIDPQTEEMIADVVRSFTDYGLNVVGAIALLVIGWTAANWAQRLVMRGLSRLPWMDQTVKPFISRVVWWIIVVFVLVAVLNQFGVQTTSIIAVLGAAGLAIGLALQGTLANVAAGVMLLILRPFNVGDYVDAGGDAGTVVEIGLFNTELKTFDGLCRLVPNSKIWTNTITNYTRNPTRRLDIPIGISYGDDIVGAENVLMDLMKGDQRILEDPAPRVLVKELADSAVLLNMRCWAKGDDYWATVFDLNKAAKIGLETAGYTIPFPQRDVHIVGGGSAPDSKP
ncbi:MAG TPA: mechanosensitive ion channel domain-containing protein [Rhodospirillales bacterium]|jgi:small conductance mechanosensitive channel